MVIIGPILLAILIAVIPIFLSRVTMKVLLIGGWSRPVSVFISSLVTSISFLMASFIAISLINLGAYAGGMGVPVPVLIAAVLLLFTAIYHYFNLIFYRLDKSVPISLKTVTTIGDISSDNKFFQIIIFLLVYGLILVTVITTCVILYYLVSDLMQGPAGYTETINGIEYFYPYNE